MNGDCRVYKDLGASYTQFYLEMTLTYDWQEGNRNGIVFGLSSEANSGWNSMNNISMFQVRNDASYVATFIRLNGGSTHDGNGNINMGDNVTYYVLRYLTTVKHNFSHQTFCP